MRSLLTVAVVIVRLCHRTTEQKCLLYALRSDVIVGRKKPIFVLLNTVKIPKEQCRYFAFGKSYICWENTFRQKAWMIDDTEKPICNYCSKKRKLLKSSSTSWK